MSLETPMNLDGEMFRLDEKYLVRFEVKKIFRLTIKTTHCTRVFARAEGFAKEEILAWATCRLVPGTIVVSVGLSSSQQW
jgi:hypothetical protein